MKKHLLSALLAAIPTLGPALAAAQAPSGPPAPPPAECSAILAKPFDGGLDPRIQPDCDATAFYYGIGRDKDLVAARSCALIERIQHVDKDGSPFTGPGILSMVYANGQGTPRDLDLARHFVCENKQAAPAETLARLQLIDKIAMTPAQPPKFDLCSTASTGPTFGWCAGLQLRMHDAKRYDELVAIVDKLTPQGQEAFKTLQTAEAAFETLRCQKEVDLTGLAGWARQIQEQDRIRAEFVADFKLFAKPDFKQPVEFPVVDALVIKDNNRLIATGDRLLSATTITVAGIEETQQSWLKYRDAWRVYEGVVNPTLSGDAVATQISRERLFHLRKLATQ